MLKAEDRTNSKNGVLEEWNDGLMEEKECYELRVVG